MRLTAPAAPITATPRVTSLAPQLLVDDSQRSIAYYRKLGFAFDEPWDGFYAIGRIDGLELHLKEAAKDQADRRHRREHLRAFVASWFNSIFAPGGRVSGSSRQNP